MFGFKTSNLKSHGHGVFRPVTEKTSLDGVSDSDSLLSERELLALRRKRPLFKRWRLVIAVHVLIAAVYAGILFAVINHYRTQVLLGPHLVYCKCPPLLVTEWGCN